ncbi:hypothetical protein GN316_11940 [Xylophilus sp. Kf1]|nr:hypothetical protein [Xylophilus sp. Kf1]
MSEAIFSRDQPTGLPIGFFNMMDNIVVKLSDSSITPFAFRAQLISYPIPGLRQVISLINLVRPLQ